MNKFLNNISKKIFAVTTTAVTAIAMISPLGATPVHALADSSNWAALYDEGAKHVGAGYSTTNRLGPDSFDCSGFVDFLMKETGIDSTPYNSAWVTSDWCNDLDAAGIPHEDTVLSNVSSITAKQGDIIMFYGSASYSAASSQHIGILKDNNTMVSAQHSGVLVQGLTSAVGGHLYVPAGNKNGTYVRIYHMPTDVSVTVNLNKKSAKTEITDGNACYSLNGAVYGIYGSKADADSNANALGTLTTDASGNASTTLKVSRSVNTLWYRELTAPAGYLIDSSAHPFAAGTANTNPTISILETPGFDPLSIKIAKTNMDIDDAEMPALDGAQFTIKYYDGQYASVDQLPANAKYTWVIETKKTDDGKYMARLDDDHLVDGSSALVKTNGAAILPVGTVTVEETKVPDIKYTAADGKEYDVYTLENKTLGEGKNELSQTSGKILMNVKLNQSSTAANLIASNAVTNNFTALENPGHGKFTLNKKDIESGRVVSQGNGEFNGGKFEVVNENSYAVKGENGAVGKGGVVLTFSLQNGVFTSDLSALTIGKYTIREVEAPKGYTLYGNTSVTIEITTNGATAEAELADKVIRGGFKIQKQDIETGTYAQGDTNLQTTFKIVNTGTNPVWVDSNGNGKLEDNEMYANGDTIKLPEGKVVTGTVTADEDGNPTFTTDKNGYFEIAEDVLPYSSYRIVETVCPTGYRSDDGSIITHDFDIVENGKIVDLTDTIKNKPITGNFDLQKMLTSQNNGMSTTSKPEAGIEFTALLKKTVDEKFGGDYKAAYKAIFNQEACGEDHTTPDDSQIIRDADGNILFTTREYDVMVTNNSGMAYSRDLAYGEYYIFQSSHSDSVVDFEGNVTTYDGSTFVVSEKNQETKHFYVTNVPMLYKLRMVKFDKQTGEKVSLSTATFRITDEDGNVVKQKLGNKVYDAFTTTTHKMVVDSEDGKKITVDTGTFVSEQPSEADEGISYTALGLEAGTYYISEIKTPEGFKTVDPIKVVIKESSITEVDEHGENIIEIDIDNTQVTSGIKLQKEIDEWESDRELFNRDDLSGVGFTLTAAEDITSPADGHVIAKAGEKAVRLTGDKNSPYETVEEFFTDEKGLVSTDGLPVGKYTLTETTVPDGMVLDKTEHSVEIKCVDEKAVVTIDGKQVSVDDALDAYTIKNAITKTEITKSDITTSKEIPGVKMEIRQNDEVVDSWTSTEKAHKISGLPYGEYELVETSTIPGYYYSETVKFTVSEEMTKVEMKDAPIIYKIEKVDENGAPVKGVTLELYDVTVDEDGKYINVDENGQPKKIELPNKGVTTGEPFVLDRVLEADHNYKLVESEYVAGLYKATDIYFNVNHIGTEEAVTITMIDETADVVVRKVDENGNPIAGAKMQVIEAKIAEPEDIVTENEATKDDAMLDDDAFTVDDQATEDTGDAEITGEAAALDDEKNEVAVEGDADKAETETADTQEATKPENPDEMDEGYTLPDSEIQYVPVKNEDGTDKVVYEFTSTDDKNGVDISDYVKGDGTYILREVEAPYGYTLANDQPFTVTGTAATCQAVIAVDMPDSYTVSVKKVDKSDASKTLEGAEFRLYHAKANKDGKNEVALDLNGKPCIATTDKTGVAKFNVSYDPEGYFVKETKAPANYKINNTKFDIKLSDDFFTKGDKVYELVCDDEKIIPSGVGLSSGLAIAGLISVSGLCGTSFLKKKKDNDSDFAE